MDDTDWSLIDFDPPKKPVATIAPVMKGCCSKCGRHIGKGLFAHTRSCDGNPSKAE